MAFRGIRSLFICFCLAVLPAILLASDDQSTVIRSIRFEGNRTSPTTSFWQVWTESGSVQNLTRMSSTWRSRRRSSIVTAKKGSSGRPPIKALRQALRTPLI